MAIIPGNNAFKFLAIGDYKEKKHTSSAVCLGPLAAAAAYDILVD
jgi:hypothetical protein